MMSEISDAIESDKISSRENRSLDLFLSDVGGILDGSIIKVPLATDFPTEIIVQTCRNENTNLVRVLSPEIFGGMIETFEIGKNQKISSGKWVNNILELYFRIISFLILCEFSSLLGISSCKFSNSLMTKERACRAF